jgi:uncharacterized protein YjiS (DUF1127 family)
MARGRPAAIDLAQGGKAGTVLPSRRRPQAGAVMPTITLLSRFAAWQTRRCTERTLQQLTDRELADIGIDRVDIPLVASRVLAPAPCKAGAATFPTNLRHAWPA